jgi:hypothetical protein
MFWNIFNSHAFHEFLLQGDQIYARKLSSDYGNFISDSLRNVPVRSLQLFCPKNNIGAKIYIIAAGALAGGFAIHKRDYSIRHGNIIGKVRKKLSGNGPGALRGRSPRRGGSGGRVRPERGGGNLPRLPPLIHCVIFTTKTVYLKMG